MKKPQRLSLVILVSVLSGPAGALAQADTDLDGAQDSADSAPCDPLSVGLAFAPARDQHGALFFEDQWPELGDADFNDAVLTYNYQFGVDALGRTSSVHLTIHAVAVGGVFDNGLGLHLPAPSSAVAQVRIRELGGAWRVAAPRADTELTIDLLTNLRSLFGGQPGQINSMSTAPAVPAASIEVEVVFHTPVALDRGAAPFDLFLFRSTNPGHEIHRSGYSGTAAMNAGLFGTASDASQPSLHFVDTRGLPFVLHLPVFTHYPEEATDIALLFPDIIGFATSGGVTNKDFYLTHVDPARAFNQGQVQVSPSVDAASLAPDLSCLPGMARVEDAFQALLGRSATQVEVLAHGPAASGAAQDPTRGLQQLAQVIIGSPEYTNLYTSLPQAGLQTAADRIFQRWLRRAPNPAEAANLVLALPSPGTALAAVQALLDSAEFREVLGLAPGILSFVAADSELVDGGSTTLAWDVTGASAVEVVGLATGLPVTTGTQTVNPGLGVITYHLRASNARGLAEQTLSLSVGLVCSAVADACSGVNHRGADGLVGVSCGTTVSVASLVASAALDCSSWWGAAR